ncbi:MAG TPA: M2 family metallopeptidase [Pyrinomonadaceae bacterium]|nr:M2 family metallopeptidase [Pyrinomonadaceae bacterium]
MNISRSGSRRSGSVWMRCVRGTAVVLACACVCTVATYAQGRTTTRGNTKRSVAGRSPAGPRATVAEAQKFVADAERRLLELGLKLGRAEWVQSNFITDDTEALAAEASKDYAAAVTELAEASRRYDGLKLPYDTARKIKLLKLSLNLPTPSSATEREELTKIAVSMESDYGKGKYCPDGPTGKCLSLGEMERILANSRDPEELQRVWLGWHRVSPPYRARYARFVELGNKGAREMGFKDVGAMWRTNYDMEPDAFAAEMERLWLQVRPLYDSLYTYTRAKLAQKYGNKLVPANGPIPAHLLGNMWAQTWGNVYPLLKPDTGDPGYDLTKILKDRKTDAKQMVRYGEKFFTSIGFDALPESFWERSLFVKPQDREVVCHASAWDLDQQKDVRIKMCIDINAEDFATVHHELGHNYYDMAYAPQSPMYRGGANDGFHEAIGDAIALSVTPEYLKQIGLIEKVPDQSADTGLLLQRALDKVAFLPFGYLVDQWRWKVFSGEVGPGDYNRAWWELRARYQGVAPPAPRTEQDFDAGAKYHVAANTPYARYFLAAILQFQFHRALCREAGFTGPLHRCSIYGNKQAGDKLKRMLALGQSRPWPEALKELTGEDKMDATAILDYFAPLKTWLDEQNRKMSAAPRAANARSQP